MPLARVLKFQQMDNWEKLDRAFKAKAGDNKLETTDPEAHKIQQDDYVDAYKEEVRRMSVSNAFLSAALLPTGFLVQQRTLPISRTIRLSHI